MQRSNLHEVLQQLYDQMMPLCQDMSQVAKGIAGLGALFYIALRVWKSLASAQPIDVYPLLRPLAIGVCIMFFPSLVLGGINGVLSPIVKGTHQILENQVVDLNALQNYKDDLKRKVLLNDPQRAYLVSNEEFDKKLEELGWSISDLASISGMYLERSMHDLQENIKEGFREFLELLFMGASLVIDTMRTFFLIVLSILGPLSFGISVWSGFESTLLWWVMRYISVYLWLPVADLFSSMLSRIQVLLLEQQIQELQNPNYIDDGSSTIYILYMIIGIIGYFTVPSVTGWIIQASGVERFTQNINRSAFIGGFITKTMLSGSKRGG